MCRYTYGVCCWRITAGNVINIFLIEDVFLPSHPTAIDPDDTFSEPSYLIHGLRSVHTQRDIAASPPCPQSNIGLHFHMQSELLMGQMIMNWEGRGSNSQGSHPCRQVPLVSMHQALVLLALKGNGR